MVNFEGAVGGPLGGGWSGRVSALYQRRDDWVTNTYPGPNDGFEGYDESAARVQLLYENEGFEALFNLHRRDLNGTARLFRANIIQPGSNRFAPGFDRDKVALDGVNFSDLETWGGSARLRWDFGDLSLHSITGYETLESLNRGDIDGGYGAVFLPDSGPGLIPFASESADGIPDHKQVSQEFRLESDYGGRFDWQAGLFWYREELTIDSFNYDSLAPGNPLAGHAVQEQENTAWAVFASGEYAATDQLKLRAGVRYTKDKKDFSASVLDRRRSGRRPAARTPWTPASTTSAGTPAPSIRPTTTSTSTRASPRVSAPRRSRGGCCSPRRARRMAAYPPPIRRR
jgi:hypothetical protein